MMLIILSACAAPAAQEGSAPFKPYGGLPPQFLGYWMPGDAHSCHGIQIKNNGNMDEPCRPYNDIRTPARYQFDCSTDSKTAYIIMNDSDYYKLVLDDLYGHKSDGFMMILVYNIGDAAKNRSDMGPVRGCDKKRNIIARPDRYYRNNGY